MVLTPREFKHYHIFLASPGDVSSEREHVRNFFERYNRQTARLWNVRFEVVDWENYTVIGVGRPQELVTQQTLEKHRDSLALVIGIMGQRFGSPTGEAESGTEEEFNWAMEHHQNHGFPEIKWFFRKVDKFEAPPDPEEILKAAEQWAKVCAFKQRIRNCDNPVFYTEYLSAVGFRDVFENDLSRWLSDSARPWVPTQSESTQSIKTGLTPPSKYYENIERDFHRLDIAGIDNDRTFEIPLSEIYVRLRVMFDEDTPEETEAHESGPIAIQTALLRYKKLVIVGDPGSGKSTFLKYIALMLARSFCENDSSIALEKLCLPEPLPVPIFLSCWDLADFLKQKGQARLNELIEFIVDRLSAYDFSASTSDVESLLESENCCLLFDGLDEVPTDAGRAAVSRLLEDCVQQYADNRYVVTSRIRAYTGDTILKGEFTRCDIQPFDVHDRAEFIRNWVALLFRILPETVGVTNNEAAQEFKGLTHGIETSDRIRPLAVNPLLLTVIAIVHWNRKRLPEQRVDLYDECVDVLLGQRKEAQRIQYSRKIADLDIEHEEQKYEERAWVRKRFAEIALHILQKDGDRDEATKADIVRLLIPRFIDQGATNEERAAIRAASFLDRQELRSGLLVSRRAQSYRFVHLTFQEYLAAWQLSNMDFDKVTEIIQSRLRLAKWFETLQLLGAQWAKESDEKAERYIAWLLDHRGQTINEQAPVVALCANIVKDISGVAELKPQTRNLFKEAVELTLAAFREASRVNAETQIEILEALGQLGAAVKPHLIDATKARLFQVRRRAIEMLLPYLSDDELFDLGHIFKDRSKKPIKTYLIELINRDSIRAKQVIESEQIIPSKVLEAILELPMEMIVFRETLTRFCVKERNLISQRLPYYYYYCKALSVLAAIWPDETTRQLLKDFAVQDKNSDTRGMILKLVSITWPDETTCQLLHDRAVNDPDTHTRSTALELLLNTWPNEDTRQLMSDCAVNDPDIDNRRMTLWLLSNTWPDETTRQLLTNCAVNDPDSNNRSTALRLLSTTWPDEVTRQLLNNRAVQDPDTYTRSTILELMFNGWPDEDTRQLMNNCVIQDPSAHTRATARRFSKRL
ncbi:MAG: NACHT domain-containing protein [Cyanobacteria bacterium P01_H01_bin.105]